MFYDSNPNRLRNSVEEYLRKAKPKTDLENPIALISPHAGYRFSGQAAAFGYKLLDKDKVERIFILAPSHMVPFRGVSIPNVDSYETPLGPVNLDTEASADLRSSDLFACVPEAHTREHSLEVQLPFLQVVLGDDFKLIPMVVGQLKDNDHAVIAKTLQKAVHAGDVVVASSDFTHQGPRFGYVPYKNNVKEKIEQLDTGAVDLILKKDNRKFIDYVNATGATICGRHPISILLELLPAEACGKLLVYYTSGDITGDESETVSYVSVVFSSPSGWPQER
jgi:AmmeMemoRadiSam system protein B